MFVFMAYPPHPFGTSDSAAPPSAVSEAVSIQKKEPVSNNMPLNHAEYKTTTTRTSTSIFMHEDEVRPQSQLSSSTAASSHQAEQAYMSEQQQQHQYRFHRVDEEVDTGRNCCASEEEQPTFGHYLQQMEDVPRAYMEKLYENTIDGPCQTVSLCEVNQMDLFVNCQQPLSFLGFGRHPGDRHSNLGMVNDETMPAPLPGAYVVPTACEYCGAEHTNQCCPQTCRRPRLYFHKKRPPFAPSDPAVWDPITDEAITANNTVAPPQKPTQQQRLPPQRKTFGRKLSQREEEEEAESNRKYWLRSLFGGTPPAT